MQNIRWWALGGLLGLAGLVLTLTAGAQTTTPPKGREPLKTALAKATKLKEADVAKLLQALGPAIRDQLNAGRQVELQGLGTFRVVQVPAHKDLVAGRPAIVPAANYVEFLPSGGLAAAANAPGAVPARTVTPYDFIINPNATAGQKVEGGRVVDRVRTR
jgi:nucleoid DNA-binding protein